MSVTSDARSDEFLAISDHFKLGSLTTESSHPVTAALSEAARKSAVDGLSLLFQVDADVERKYAELVVSGRMREIANAVLGMLKSGGRLFFTGCGSTGRLSIQLVAIWRDFWQSQAARGLRCDPVPTEWEHRAFSVMAGGDFALIKAVEGFEDFTMFGKRQLSDLGVRAGDVVFAITEGGETSFVIGTAWQGIAAGAKVYFVYNNPDDVLCEHVQRSRDVILDSRIEKLNLTTGPMAITGSTRMQATSIQLAVLLTVLEMVLRDLLRGLNPEVCSLASDVVPEQFMAGLREMLGTLRSPAVLGSLATLVELEERVYRLGHRNNYYADRFGIDVLTDTTERSPTYCTPPFRKFDDTRATESWAFLFVPHSPTPHAWERIIKRPPKCIEWSADEVLQLVGPRQAPQTNEILRRISYAELMRFRVGMDGLPFRQLSAGDSAIAVVAANECDALIEPSGFFRTQLESARREGVKRGLVCFGRESLDRARDFVREWDEQCARLIVPAPRTDLLLDGVTRVGLKLLLNALSTCTMVRLGRVMGNYMVWVVASNLKLIDRATRYIQKLSNLDYRAANRLLFEVTEYVEPRMKADQVYPPVVAVAVMRARYSISNEEAERRFAGEFQ